MVTNKELRTLFNNLSNGLKTLSVQELSDVIYHAKPPEMQILERIVCAEFNVSPESLREKYARNDNYLAKCAIFAILRFNKGLSNRQIAKDFKVFPTAVNVAIKFFKDLNPEKFKADKLFLEKYEKCLSEFLNEVK